MDIEELKALGLTDSQAGTVLAKFGDINNQYNQALTDRVNSEARYKNEIASLKQQLSNATAGNTDIKRVNVKELNKHRLIDDLGRVNKESSSGIKQSGLNANRIAY